MKNIIITGASHGIGKAAAEALAAKDVRLFLNCKDSVEELKEFCGKLAGETGCLTVPVIADVASDTEVEAMFHTIFAHTKRIDALVNSAGVAHMALLQDTTPADWNRVIGTDLTGVYLTCRQVIPPMVRAGSGRIINISSVWGGAGAAGEAAYAAAKGGVNALTKSLAKELAPAGIQVNAIACGLIDTRMNDCLTEEEKKALIEEIPAGRQGTAGEVADLIRDLIYGHPYLTGQIITLDGGWI